MVARAWGRTNEGLLTKDQKALVKVSTNVTQFGRFRRPSDWVAT